MSRLGLTLSQAHLIGWRNVADFVRHLDQGSAVWRALYKKEAAYGSPYHIALMLADLFDLLNTSRGDGRKARWRPKHYPRPGKDEDSKRIGRGAIAVSDFNDWYYGGNDG